MSVLAVATKTHDSQPHLPTELIQDALEKVAAISSSFNWIGFYELAGDRLVLGPFIGEPTEHQSIEVGKGVCGRAVAEDKDLNIPDVTQEANYLACFPETRSELVVLVRDAQGKVLGQIDIDSLDRDAFGDAETEKRVRKIAEELGVLWKEQENQK